MLSATRFRPVDGRPTWLAPDDAPDGRRILLGDRDGVIHVAVIADPSMADGQDDWTGLRGAVQTIDETDAELLVQAVGIAEWHWATRHCPRCGGTLERATPGTSCAARCAAARSSRAQTRP